MPVTQSPKQTVFLRFLFFLVESQARLAFFESGTWEVFVLTVVGGGVTACFSSVKGRAADVSLVALLFPRAWKGFALVVFLLSARTLAEPVGFEFTRASPVDFPFNSLSFTGASCA